MKVVHGSRYRKSRMRMLALLFVIALTAIALIFARPNQDSAESLTEDWGQAQFNDYGIGILYPDNYTLSTDGETLIELYDTEAEMSVLNVVAYSSSEQESLADWLKRSENLEGITRTIGESTQAIIAIDEQGQTNLVFEHQDRIFQMSSPLSEEELATMLDAMYVFDSPETADAEGRARLLALTDIAFRELYNAAFFTNTTRPSGDNKPEITGDASADAHIQMLAEARGYRLQPIRGDGEVGSADGYTLQTPTADAWRSLKAAAAADGIALSVTSGYRSVADQQQIFLTRLGAACGEILGGACSNAQIASGEADRAIDDVLKTSSIPGYSRHHSGHTVDIGQDGVGAFEDFFGTPGWDWISGDNYANAKRFGFIPSYPPNGGLQGPDPEPWEYVYIGPEFFRIGE